MFKLTNLCKNNVRKNTTICLYVETNKSIFFSCSNSKMMFTFIARILLFYFPFKPIHLVHSETFMVS